MLEWLSYNTGFIVRLFFLFFQILDWVLSGVNCLTKLVRLGCILYVSKQLIM